MEHRVPEGENTVEIEYFTQYFGSKYENEHSYFQHGRQLDAQRYLEKAGNYQQNKSEKAQEGALIIFSYDCEYQYADNKST